MHATALLPLVQSVPGQAGTVVKTVTSAYEQDVLVATIALLVVAVLGLFTLLLRSYRDRAVDTKTSNEKHEKAVLAQREQDAQRFREQDERVYNLLERVTSALVNVSNTVREFTEELKALRGRK